MDVFAPQDVKNHYIEFEPCIMMQITEDTLDRHLLLPEPDKEKLIALFKIRREQERQTGNVKFFTRQGMEQFAKTGCISQFPAQIYKPLTIPERIDYLECFLS